RTVTVSTPLISRLVPWGGALPELVPIIEPLLDLALEAALAGPVEIAARHPVREIVLAGKAFPSRVVVDIAAPVAEVAHQPGRRGRPACAPANTAPRRCRSRAAICARR